MPDFNLDTLNCVYFAMLLFGFGYALFIVVTGGLSSVDMPDVDVDIPQINLPGDVDIPGANVHVGGAELPSAGIDTPDVSVSPLSPITVASFITTFGGVGIICNEFFGLDPRLGLLVATVSGLAVSTMMYFIVTQFLIRSQASSELRSGELLGKEAEVTVPIGETGPGQVSYLTKSGRMSSIARSVDGKPIPRGQAVIIVRTVGPQVLVQAIAPDES